MTGTRQAQHRTFGGLKSLVVAVVGGGSESDYSVCPHHLLQFYTYLCWTGQDVRYSSLHQFISAYVVGQGRGARQKSTAILKLLISGKLKDNLVFEQNIKYLLLIKHKFKYNIWLYLLCIFFVIQQYSFWQVPLFCSDFYCRNNINLQPR